MTKHPPEGGALPKRALVLSGGGGRGAFECGAIEKLAELGWQPDVLVGTSIGSMNAAVWALDGVQGVGKMWDQLRTRKMHRFLRLWPWKSLLDRAAWRKTLQTFAPEERLKNMNAALYIVATHIATGDPVVFTNSVDYDGSKPFYQKVPAINHDHLLASSAIPYVYPRIPVEDDDHWDGAVTYNSPLRPAIDSKALEILVVLLTPYHNILKPGLQLPPALSGIAGKIGHLLDITITATFENDFEQMRKINKDIIGNIAKPNHRKIKCSMIGPEDWMPSVDILSYRPKRIEKMRADGREAAQRTWDRIKEQGWDSLVGL